MDTQAFCEYTGADERHAHRLLTLAKGEMGLAMHLWATEQGFPCTFSVDKQDTVQTECTDLVDAMKSSSYGKIMNILQNIDTLSRETDLRFPRIVVIGSECSGKSSTLERIAGLSLFPRDSKICTRMPIVLRLINIQSENVCDVIILKHPKRPDVHIKEKDALAAIIKFMNDIVPSGTGVIEEPLTIEIRKKSVPFLELIDLPGIVGASIDGEPSDMMHRTREITDKYLRCKDTIIVAVVPANITRVRDSQAMQMVQANKKESVTLGVLAKCDLAYDPRFKQHQQNTPYWQLEERLTGDADDMITLSNAWLAVKNRDSRIAEEEALNFSEYLEAERDWFADNTAISKEVRDRQCGIDALLKSIDGLFTKYFWCTWVPKAILHVKSKMAAVKTKLQALGPLPQLLSLGEVLDAFVDEFEVRSLVYDHNEERYHDVSVDVFWTPYGSVESKVKEAVCKVQDHFIDEYVETVERDVRDSFSAQRTGLCLYRFQVLCEKVVEVVRFLMSTHTDNIREKLEIFFRQVLYMSQVFHGGNIDNGAVNRVIRSIIREELRIGAVVDNADKLKRLVMQRLFLNDADALQCCPTDFSHDGVHDHNASSPNFCALHDGGHGENTSSPKVGVFPSNGLIESCAVTRVNLVRDQFNLFIALGQLEKLQGVAEESDLYEEEDGESS